MRKPPLPVVQYIIFPDSLLILLIATQPTALIRFIGFCTFTYLSLQPLSFTAGNPTQDYFIGFVLASQILLAIQLLWLRNPLDELRHERDKVPARDLPLWRRLYWAFCLDHSVRAIGWTHQVRNVPSRPNEPRWTFVRSRIFQAALQLLLADIANTYILVIGALYSTSPHGYALRCSTIVAWVTLTYATVNVQYFTLGVLSVGLDVSHPEDWPKVFGQWADAYTLRNFWGKVWHQNLRRLFTPISTFLTHLFGFKRGTNASSYTQLYTSFLLSGVIHSAADAMVDWKFVGRSMPFFLIQAAAITVEDVVIALFRKMRVPPSQLTYLVGYVWVFLWAVYSFSIYRDLALEAGWGWSSEWPFSLAGTGWKAFQASGWIDAAPIQFT